MRNGECDLGFWGLSEFFILRLIGCNRVVIAGAVRLKNGEGAQGSE